MKTLLQKGTNNQLFLVLHGSRSKLEPIIDIANKVDENATVIGFQGDIHQRGARRYFSRHVDGDYDLVSLEQATKEFYRLLVPILEDYKDYEITCIGYSNGGNLLVNTLKEYRNLNLDNVVLLHPASITPNKKFKNQQYTDVLFTTGKKDSFMPKEDFITIQDNLLAAKITFKTYIHDGGHEIGEDEKAFVINYLKSTITKG